MADIFDSYTNMDIDVDIAPYYNFLPANGWVEMDTAANYLAVQPYTVTTTNLPGKSILTYLRYPLAVGEEFCFVFAASWEASTYAQPQNDHKVAIFALSNGSNNITDMYNNYDGISLNLEDPRPLYSLKARINNYATHTIANYNLPVQSLPWTTSGVTKHYFRVWRTGGTLYFRIYLNENDAILNQNWIGSSTSGLASTGSYQYLFAQASYNYTYGFLDSFISAKTYDMQRII